MTLKPMSSGTSPIRRLREADRGEVLAHLRALPQEDQRLRFGHAASDVITHYVSDIDFHRDHLFAAHTALGRIVGLAHVPMRRNVAELGLSILPAARRQGLGHALSRHSLQAAGRAGGRAFRFHFASSNEAMRRIATSLGMRVGRDGSDLVAQRPLAAARELEPTAETWQPKLKVLDEQTRHHHEETEEHLFPNVKKICSDDELGALAQEMLACQAALVTAGEERAAVVEQIEKAAPLK